MKPTIPSPNLEQNDPEVAKLVGLEEQRQLETIDLIPSENYASAAVREALASVFTNKYSEGYPGARYYPGNIRADEIEALAQKRALAAFGLNENEWGVNVQALSGSPANFSVYAALMEPGDRALGMKLAHGGHLTHGHKVSFTGKFFTFAQYGLTDEGYIDFEQVEQLAQEQKPKIIVCGATAYSRTIDFARFSEIAKKHGALLMMDMAHIAGLIAAGAHPSPFPYCDIVTTTTHKTLRGPRGAMIFAKTDLLEKINKAVFPGMQGGPHDNTTAAIAVALAEAQTKEFKAYANQIVKNAQALADGLLKEGHNIVSGGTDNHLFLLDLRGKELTGGEAEKRLEEINIIANRNTVPNDPRKPFDPSGVRFGTPAVTTRGMKEGEIQRIASWIHRALTEGPSPALQAEVRELALTFPPPGFEK